jgi:hypothetical protein
MTMEQFQIIAAQPVWQVLDNHTGAAMGKPLNRRAASRKVDRLDNEYGGYRYSVKQVQS